MANLGKTEPPEIMRELEEFLEDRDHECVKIVGLQNHKFEWCQQDECLKVQIRNDRKKKEEELEKFLDECVGRPNHWVTVEEGWTNHLEELDYRTNKSLK